MRNVERGIVTPTRRSSPGVATVDGVRAAQAAARPRFSERTRKREATLRRTLAAADGFIVAVALLLVTISSASTRLHWPALAVPVAFIAMAKVARLYENDALQLRRSTLDEIPMIFTLTALVALLAWLGGSAVVDGELSRGQVAGLWGGTLAGIVLARAAARAAVRRVRTVERCMLVGGRDVWDRLEQSMSLRTDLELATHYPMRVPEGEERFAMSEALRSAQEQLGETAKRDHIDRILIAISRNDAFDENMLDGIFALEQLGLRVSVVPHMLEVIGSAAELEDFDGLPVLGIRSFGLNRTSRTLKRAFDLVIATGIVVVTSPLFLAAAIAVRRSGPGPIFYRQRRVGLHGEEFELLKFRSMVDGADAMQVDLSDLNETGGVFKLADDPRITPAGRWMRRTSVDELPQLLNVLRGTMSLVGPRPLVPWEDAQVLGWRRRRLELPPGMTGPWQVLVSTRVPLNEMVKMDYLYIANWSPWADLKALAQTLPHVLGRRGL